MQPLPMEFVNFQHKKSQFGRDLWGPSGSESSPTQNQQHQIRDCSGLSSSENLQSLKLLPWKKTKTKQIKPENYFGGIDVASAFGVICLKFRLSRSVSNCWLKNTKNCLWEGCANCPYTGINSFWITVL